MVLKLSRSRTKKMGGNGLLTFIVTYIDNSRTPALFKALYTKNLFLSCPYTSHSGETKPFLREGGEAKYESY